VTPRQWRGWLIVASLFVALFVVFGGGYDTSGVFFAPMLKHFGWSSTRMSSLQTILALTAGVTVPIFGWLLDNIEARVVMTAGVLSAGGGLLLASQAHSFAMLAIAYIALGAGIAAATLLPAGLVIANWFEERRGIALGIATTGTSIGGMVMTVVAEYAIQWSGWRAGFIALALPAFVIAAPLVALTVRSRPPDEKHSDAPGGNPLAGLDIGPALRSLAFWMVATAQFCFSFAGAGGTLHTVRYLTLCGFQAERAAEIFSITFGLASLGKFLMGYTADFVTGRVALGVCLAVGAVGQLFLLGSPNLLLIALYVVLYGIMSGAPLALIPMVIAESFGLKRFGSVSGLTGIFITLGGATGPLVGGLIYDSGLGYPAVFILYAAVMGVGSAAALACPPLK
jgi:MFS family permease